MAGVTGATWYTPQAHEDAACLERVSSLSLLEDVCHFELQCSVQKRLWFLCVYFYEYLYSFVDDIYSESEYHKV